MNETRRKALFGISFACDFHFMLKLVSVFCYVFVLLLSFMSLFSIILFSIVFSVASGFAHLPTIYTLPPLRWTKKLQCLFDFVIWSIEVNDKHNIKEAHVIWTKRRYTTKLTFLKRRQRRKSFDKKFPPIFSSLCFCF